MSFPATQLLLTIGLVCHWPAQALGQSDTAALAVVRAYMEAYNSHDVDGVVRMLSPDFTWLSLSGDSVTVEVRGASAVRASLVQYFRAFPSARSEIEGATVLGPWVTVRERAHWQSAAGPRSQAAISVYEVRGGLLRRVWYYPVVKS
ncbi:MAG: nuclear transport factor 2 family protein [Gemmatimonadales bacterium]|nr:nuclear transport factor 2 family protein [Gemmatimonadales bacterium]